MKRSDHGRHSAILDLLVRRYDRPVINNRERADYVECLIVLALGEEWELTWAEDWDWAPWDCQNSSGARLEIKQGAARQPWDRDAVATAREARFDIAPRTGYWTRDGSWIDRPGRPADVYVLAWHGDCHRETADHRDAGQWRFFVTAESALPPGRKSISLAALETLVDPCGIDGIRQAVENVLPVRSELKAVKNED